ncbi:serine/threonine-protein kinase [Acrocarpospora sp. B8E8]|uniref:serine/threonine-protein kinase n=1 Tax=Acrocarpospora sp. B8E8 TaxID=3153572 RepID=UPI00325F8CA2
MSESGRLLADRFRLVSRLGAGGMGVVWRATDELLGREVAVKEVRGLTTDASVQDRMMREARAAARLRHPGVITVYDVVREDDELFIVMELVEAPSLRELVERDGPLPPEQVAAIGIGVLEALGEAHRIGVIHRDVKPGNVLVLPRDRTKLGDFGIARLAGDPTLTEHDSVLGTPAYIAPEQLRGAPGTPATDLWALGATLYYAVQGASPFDRDTAAAAIAAVLTDAVPAPDRAGPLLGDLLIALLARSPAERPSAEAVHAALERAAVSKVSPNRPATAEGPVVDTAETDTSVIVVPASSQPRRHRLPRRVGVGLACILVSTVILVTVNRSPSGPLASGEVVFADDFSAAADGWRGLEVPGAGSEWRDGAYRLRIDSPNSSARFVPFAESSVYPVAPAQLRVDVRARLLPGGSEAGYGLTCRMNQDFTQGYAFLIWDGSLQIAKLFDQAPWYTTLLNIPLDQLDVDVHAVNRLQAVCADEAGQQAVRLRFWVNGGLMEVTDREGPFMTGTTGLLVASGATSSGRVEAEFDDFAAMRL